MFFRAQAVYACSQCGDTSTSPYNYHVCGCGATSSFIYMSLENQQFIAGRYKELVASQTRSSIGTGEPMTEEERQAGIDELWPR